MRGKKIKKDRRPGLLQRYNPGTYLLLPNCVSGQETTVESCLCFYHYMGFEN